MHPSVHQNFAQRGRRLDGQRVLCAAEGILVGLRRCSVDDAFRDILCTAREYNVAPLRLAAALLAVAQNDVSSIDGDALDAALRTWGPLFLASSMADADTVSTAH